MMIGWPAAWPNPLSASTDSPQRVYSVYATYSGSEISKITAHLGKTTPGNGQARAALYSAAAGFIGESSTITVPGSTPAGAWLDLPCPTPIPFAFGTSYILCVGMTEMVNARYDLFGSYDPDSWHPSGQAITVTDAVGVSEPTMARGHAMTLTDSVGAAEPDQKHIAPCWGRYINLRDMLGI